MSNLFHRRLRAGRHAIGCRDAAYFAEMVDIEPGRYASMENGDAEPTLLELEVLSKTLGVPVDMLVTGYPCRNCRVREETPARRRKARASATV